MRGLDDKNRLGLNRAEELKNCTFCKTVLMFCVILYHCVAFWNGWFLQGGSPAMDSPALSFLAQWLSKIHVTGFTLVSGYLFYHVAFEKKGNYPTFGIFLKKKSVRLILPYITASVLWVIPAACVILKNSGIEILDSFLLGESPNQLWFLLMLFCVSVIGYLFRNVWADSDLLGFISVSVLYVVSTILTRIGMRNYFQILSAFQYLTLFFIGFKIRQRGSEILYRVPAAAYILLDLVIMLLGRYCNGSDLAVMKFAAFGLNWLRPITGSVMAFVVLQKLASRIKWKENRIFAFFSRLSLPIYLFYQQFIYPVILLLNGRAHPYLHAAINFAFSTFGALVITEILCRFRLTRKLIGMKGSGRHA